VENLLTDVLFIDRGRIVLDSAVDALGSRFVQVQVEPAQLAAARAAHPLHERELFGRHVLLFDGANPEELAAFGERRTPTVADLFVAMMEGARS